MQTILTEQTVYLLTWGKALVTLFTISVPHLIYSLLSYSMTLTVCPIQMPFNPFPALTAQSTAAQLLVICHVILSLGSRTQLLDSGTIPQHLRPVEGTTAPENRRSRTAPRCQYHRDTSRLSHLP